MSTPVVPAPAPSCLLVWLLPEAFTSISRLLLAPLPSLPRGGHATVSTRPIPHWISPTCALRCTLQRTIYQTEASRDLGQDHEVLRRKLLATRRRAEDLNQQLADAANAASPYLLFCQHKFDVELADCLNALQKRMDNSRELEACCLRYHDLEPRYDETVSEFQSRVPTLEAQLVAASSSGGDKAAQAEIDRLEAVIERKTRHFRALREAYERRLKVAYKTIDAHSPGLTPCIKTSGNLPSAFAR
ncbi:hypothetical protein F443_18301 [Phytophthora nicotianae P1569]|uniref:Uncharacterized protein n=1 Tax=Phytophthora nicotianae P1569 TaxID=1317065 RepID=V9E8F8_PHYNI|nr:hypothetical protein F443_18301 [Phytophthora nicotianae P1569]